MQIRTDTPGAIELQGDALIFNNGQGTNWFPAKVTLWTHPSSGKDWYSIRAQRPSDDGQRWVDLESWPDELPAYDIRDPSPPLSPPPTVPPDTFDSQFAVGKIVPGTFCLARLRSVVEDSNLPVGWTGCKGAVYEVLPLFMSDLWGKITAGTDPGPYTAQRGSLVGTVYQLDSPTVTISNIYRVPSNAPSPAAGTVPPDIPVGQWVRIIPSPAAVSPGIPAKYEIAAVGGLQTVDYKPTIAVVTQVYRYTCSGGALVETPVSRSGTVGVDTVRLTGRDLTKVTV